MTAVAIYLPDRSWIEMVWLVTTDNDFNLFRYFPTHEVGAYLRFVWQCTQNRHAYCPLIYVILCPPMMQVQRRVTTFLHNLERNFEHELDVLGPDLAT